MPCQRVPGFGGPPFGRVRGVQRPVGYQEAEGAQRMGSLRVLPHGLPGQGDWREVLQSNRVSAASLAETGSAAKNITRQGLRTTKATTSREGRRSGPCSQGRPHEGPSRVNSGRECCWGQRTQLQKRIATWSFPAIGRNRELVWLRATRSQHVGVTRITHQAVMRLGLPQSVTEAFQVRLKFSSEPRFVLRAEGVETLECVRPKNERNDSRVLQPDMFIG